MHVFGKEEETVELAGIPDMGEHAKLHIDNKQASGSNWGPWSCELLYCVA